MWSERQGCNRYSLRRPHAGDENTKLKIECFFDSADPKDERQIKRLEKGQTITVRGEYDGRISNLQIRECVLVP